jgi:hypothetical protein
MGLMKNINQIFKNNKELMNHNEVQELIDYCVELEGQVVEKKIDDTYSKEEIYLQILKDIYESCGKTLEDDQLSERFKETPRVDFKGAVINLKKYMGAVSQMYGIKL